MDKDLSEYDITFAILKKIKDDIGDNPLSREIYSIMGEAISESIDAVHCELSASSSVGWGDCAAYQWRKQKWNGSKEPSTIGTIIHFVMSEILIRIIKGDELKDERFDALMWLLKNGGEYLNEPGIKSVWKILNLVTSNPDTTWNSEVFICYDKISIPKLSMRFGGSIDLLGIDTARKIITVIDLKTGKNVVHPDSWQLACYAMMSKDYFGYIKDFSEYKFVCGISQNGSIQSETFTYKELADKEDHIKDQVKKIEFAYDNGISTTDKNDMKYPDLFKSNKCCRFCKGCRYSLEQ